MAIRRRLSLALVAAVMLPAVGSGQIGLYDLQCAETVFGTRYCIAWLDADVLFTRGLIVMSTELDRPAADIMQSSSRSSATALRVQQWGTGWRAVGVGPA